MIKIVTNDQGSGDWILIERDGQIIFEGHHIRPFELEDILKALGHAVSLTSVTDSGLHTGNY